MVCCLLAIGSIARLCEGRPWRRGHPSWSTERREGVWGVEEAVLGCWRHAGDGDVQSAPRRYSLGTGELAYPLPDYCPRLPALVAVLIIAGVLNDVLLLIVTLVALAVLAARVVRRFVWSA